MNTTAQYSVPCNNGSISYQTRCLKATSLREQKGFVIVGTDYSIQKHRITVTEKSVFLLSSGFVERHDVLIASESAHQHHQRTFWEMEIGDEHVHNLEVETGRDEDVGVAAGLMVLGVAFQCADSRRAHRDHAATFCFAFLNSLQRLGRDTVALEMHGVIGDVVGFDGLESVGADV